MHPQQQQKKPESPVNPTDSRDLAKISFGATQSLSIASGSTPHSGVAPTSLGEAFHLSTLISLHTCLRV